MYILNFRTFLYFDRTVWDCLNLLILFQNPWSLVKSRLILQMNRQVLSLVDIARCPMGWG